MNGSSTPVNLAFGYLYLVVIVKSSQRCSTDADWSQPLCPYHNKRLVYSSALSPQPVNALIFLNKNSDF